MKLLLKYIIYCWIIISGLHFYKGQLTQSENYIYSKAYLEAVSTSSNTAKSSQSVTYYDGLGKPKQIISVKAGGTTTTDLVTPIIYDDFARQELDVLPIPASTSNKAIHPGLTESGGIGFYGSRPFAEKKFETSPLNRVSKQIQPGSDWQSHPITYAYQTNNSTDVLMFSTDTRKRNGIFYTYALKVNGFYPTSKLYKNKVSDEDGKTTYEFKNKEGQTLLVRKFIVGFDIAEQMDRGAEPQLAGQFVDTYYVYNEYNQLAFVISPLASAEFRANSNQTISDPQNNTNTIMNNLCYQYNYDGQNRLVEKKLPGKGWEYMVYDKADRLIMTQDSEMRKPENNYNWLITKYDKFGRVAYTGFISEGANGTRENMQGQANNHVITEERHSTGFLMNGVRVYYTNSLFVGINTVMSVNYYDTYPTGTPLPANNKIQDEPILLATYDGLGLSTKTLPLATMVKNINDDKWTKSYNYYDSKGRVIGTTSINHLNGRTRVEMKLDFVGVVKHSETWHNKVSIESPIHIIEDFEYDHQNRLTKHYHEVEGKTPKELLSENSYDELGRLITKKVGVVSNANFEEVTQPLQTIKFNYNIRGWMTGINLNNDNLDTNKLFSYKIKYNDPVNTTIKKYNGNISEIDWIYGSNNGNRYEYTYDDLNRLKKGYYKTLNVSTTTDSKYYNEELTYDINGNIKSLKRNARPRTGTTANLVDNLLYYYEDNELSNRLHRITDNEGAVANPSGYPGGGGINTYDSNGSIKTIPDRGITVPITYNYLNLPQTITKNTQVVTYTYRADGTKVHKSFEVNGRNIQSWYLDGFVYTTPYTPDIVMALQETLAAEEMSVAGQRESFELAEKAVVGPGDPDPIDRTTSAPNFFSTAEGFYDFYNFRYIYQYKDHLGNTRLNYGRDVNGELFKEDSNDYYPFGLNFINPFGSGVNQLFNPSATYKNYKFQEQELQETGFYAFKWRQYMPDIGRFFNIDPLAEKYPYNGTYNFSENRVIDGRELEGLEWVGTKYLNTNGVTQNVEITADYKALNNSAIANFQDKIGSAKDGIESAWTGRDSNGVSVSTSVNMAIVNSIDRVNDFSIEIVNQISGAPSQSIIGVSEFDSNQKGVMQIKSSLGIAKTGLIAGHEAGHQNGLLHQGDPINSKAVNNSMTTNNIMLDKPTGNEVTTPQLDTIQNKIPTQQLIELQNNQYVEPAFYYD